MASKKTRIPSNNSAGISSNELLDELASFLYDAYQHNKDKVNDRIVLEKGQIAENEENTK